MGDAQAGRDIQLEVSNLVGRGELGDDLLRHALGTVDLTVSFQDDGELVAP